MNKIQIDTQTPIIQINEYLNNIHNQPNVNTNDTINTLIKNLSDMFTEYSKIAFELYNEHFKNN